MKKLLTAFLNFVLDPINLKVVRARTRHRTLPDSPGIDLFHDLTEVINRDDPLCLDVGANEGQTIESLKGAFADPFIHSFEPSPKTFAILKSKDRGPRVILHRCAFGAEVGEREFNVYSDSVMDSFLPLEDVEENRFRVIELERTETVAVDTVDLFLERNGIDGVDLLKVDTQGFDLEVLKGAGKALRSGAVRTVLVELNFIRMYEGQGAPEEIIRFLKECGLLLVDYYEKTRQKNTLAWCTALFGRRE